jgi:hypothetical protein
MYIGTVEPPIPGDAVTLHDLELLERIGVNWRRETQPAEILVWFAQEPADWSELTEILHDILERCPEEFDHIAIQWIKLKEGSLDQPGTATGSCEVIFRDKREVFHTHTAIPKIVKDYREAKEDPVWFDTKWSVEDLRTVINEKKNLEQYCNPTTRWDKVWQWLGTISDEELASIGKDIKRQFSDRTTELSWEVIDTLVYDRANELMPEPLPEEPPTPVRSFEEEMDEE